MDEYIVELDDEEAIKHMQNMIDQSVTSFMTRVAEFQHSIAQWAKSWNNFCLFHSTKNMSKYFQYSFVSTKFGSH